MTFWSLLQRQTGAGSVDRNGFNWRRFWISSRRKLQYSLWRRQGSVPPPGGESSSLPERGSSQPLVVGSSPPPGGGAHPHLGGSNGPHPFGGGFCSTPGGGLVFSWSRQCPGPLPGRGSGLLLDKALNFFLEDAMVLIQEGVLILT